MLNMMIKLIVTYLAIFVSLTICNNRNESRERVFTKSESRERAIANPNRNKAEDDVRKDLLDHISTRMKNSSTLLLKKTKADSIEIKCGGNISVYTTQEITSPLYPNKYGANTDCLWNIEAQKGQTIKIQIFKLNIEYEKDCRFDYLHIKGVKKLCGKISDTEVSINSSKAELHFHSDTNNADFGFHIRVVAESRDCISQLNVTNFAFITSPKYPSNYDDSTDCWTLVRAEPGTTLVLTFEVLDLEHDQHCAYDYLEVFDSQFANNSIGKFCEKPQNVTLTLESSSNALLLHFHSDQLLHSKGFRADVVTSRTSVSDFGCDWKVNWNNMSLTSPSYPANYPPNMNCELAISAPTKEEKVVILFDWIHLEVGPNCDSSDRIEMWENETSPTRVICGRKTTPFKYVSKSRIVKLKFISDDFAENPGFKASITFLNSNTDNEKPGFKIISKLVHSPQNQSVIIGSSHVLNCDPFNNELITWFKDDKAIKTGVSSNGKTLIIREFTTQSAGRYICKFGKEYREAWLRVRQTDCPSVIFRKRPKDLKVSEGDFVMLECNVADLKGPLIWEKDGIQLTNNSRIHQLPNGYLLIDSALDEDSGIYFCVVKSNSPDCDLKSGARISVNQRVNVDTVCGISRPEERESDNGKIIGGLEADRNAFPWHVMFWDYRRKSFCGGALLNERWVATAAHCFETGPESSIEVKLGKYDQTVTEETEVIAKIAEIIRHPDFSRETFDNDLALVRLSHHISFTPQIIPICLVDKQERKEIDQYFLSPSSGLRLGHVTGWGQLKENGPQPRFLQELRVPIVDESKCRASTGFKVTSNMFCAGYGKEVLGDACKGDSGGPFVVPYKSRWILLGVVSWGEGCGRHGKYGFYTKIHNYLEWINAIVKL